jgi:hypothetical protein
VLRRSAIALVVAAALLLPLAAGAEAKVKAFVSCSPKHKPSHDCSTLDSPAVANFTNTRHRKVTYRLCLAPPQGKPNCTTKKTGAAGEVSRAHIAHWQRQIGIYKATWSVAGTVVATWSYDFLLMVY